MFYERVKKGWEEGKVCVGLPAADPTCPGGTAAPVSVNGNGLLGLMVLFLSRKERQSLANLSKAEALSVKARIQ